MLKFTVPFKKPCNTQSNTAYAQEHANATQETHPHLFGVTKLCLIDGTLYVNYPKHYTGVIHQRVKGGKWEVLHLRRGISPEKYLEMLKAKPTDFSGQPRVKKAN